MNGKQGSRLSPGGSRAGLQEGRRAAHAPKGGAVCALGVRVSTSRQTAMATTCYPSQTKRKRAPRRDVPELAAIDHAADFLNVHPRTVRRMIAAGKLRAYRVGRLLRVDMREVHAIASQPVDPQTVGR